MSIPGCIKISAKLMVMFCVLNMLSSIDGFGPNIRSLASFFILSMSGFLCMLDVFVQRKKVSHVALYSFVTMSSVALGVWWALNRGFSV